MKIGQTFVADIFETAEISQSVVCYITDIYPNPDGDMVADVEIKMQLFVKPPEIRWDIQPYIEYDFGLKLGYVKYTLAPQQTYIHP